MVDDDQLLPQFLAAHPRYLEQIHSVSTPEHDEPRPRLPLYGCVAYAGWLFQEHQINLAEATEMLGTLKLIAIKEGMTWPS